MRLSIRSGSFCIAWTISSAIGRKIEGRCRKTSIRFEGVYHVHDRQYTRDLCSEERIETNVRGGTTPKKDLTNQPQGMLRPFPSIPMGKSSCKTTSCLNSWCGERYFPTSPTFSRGEDGTGIKRSGERRREHPHEGGDFMPPMDFGLVMFSQLAPRCQVRRSWLANGYTIPPTQRAAKTHRSR